jgi:hypothetical protein
MYSIVSISGTNHPVCLIYSSLLPHSHRQDRLFSYADHPPLPLASPTSNLDTHSESAITSAERTAGHEGCGSNSPSLLLERAIHATGTQFGRRRRHHCTRIRQFLAKQNLRLSFPSDYCWNESTCVEGALGEDYVDAR